MPQMACIRPEVAQRRKKLLCQGQGRFTKAFAKQPVHSQRHKVINNGNVSSQCLSLDSKPVRQNVRNYAPRDPHQVPSSFFQEASEFKVHSIQTHCSKLSPATGLSGRMAGSHPVADTADCEETNSLHTPTKELVQLA